MPIITLIKRCTETAVTLEQLTGLQEAVRTLIAEQNKSAETRLEQIDKILAITIRVLNSTSQALTNDLESIATTETPVSER